LPVALRESGFEGASARSHLGQVWTAGSVPWNVLNVWPYEPWISGKG
jgi:hypothetical protein